MELSIKNPQAHRLARELAQLTGQSMTKAVIQALEAEIARKQPHHSVADRRAILHDIRRQCAAELPKGLSSDIINDLYDDDGLPA
ncbi:MAG: type II toxin-antitoxin system VapB family antitoxin [Chloroflexota bacterium]